MLDEIKCFFLVHSILHLVVFLVFFVSKTDLEIFVLEVFTPRKLDERIAASSWFIDLETHFKTSCRLFASGKPSVYDFCSK